MSDQPLTTEEHLKQLDDHLEAIARGLKAELEVAHAEIKDLAREVAFLRGETASLHETVERVPGAIETGTRLLYDHLEFLRSDLKELGRPRRRRIVR